ncbi:MAG: hypothetical protein AAF798_03895 [Bacteroidota bacterium]
MKKSTLVYVFQSLNKKEIRELRKFVRSPFFNHRKDVIDLFRYLVTAKAYDKASAFEYMYPGAPYEDSKLRHAMSFLLQNIKQYLLWQSLEEESSTKHLRLCAQWRKRGLEKLVYQELTNTSDHLEQQTLQNANTHLQHYRLHLARHEWEYNQVRSGKAYLQQLLDEFTNYYLSEVLRFGCTIQSYQQISSEVFDLSIVDAVLHFIEQQPNRTVPAVATYHSAYLALKQPEQLSYFEDFKQQIAANSQAFTLSEQKELYLLGINYCIRKLNQGEAQFIREALNFYKEALQKDLLLENGILSKFNYNNVLMLALAEKEWEWAKSFLDGYHLYLPQKERSNIYTYNLAIYHFRKEDYVKAMEFLRTVSFDDIQYELNARRMLLRIYYETDEFDALESLLDSFQQFLRRHKELGYHRANYANLLMIVRQMVRSNLHDTAVRAELQQQVEQTNSLAEKEWLLTQLR